MNISLLASPYFMAIISAALFGAAMPASKPLLNTFSSTQLAGMLYLGAALASIPWAFRGAVRNPWQLDAKNLRLLFGAIIFGGVLGPVFVLLGLKASPAASISLWLNLELVATAVLGALFFRDALGRHGWMAAGIATLAAAALAWDGGTAGIHAAFLVVLACICWGLDNQMTALIDGITPANSTLWKGLAAGGMNLCIGVMLSPWTAGLAQVAQALAVGALCYGASIILYITAAQRLGATRSQVIFSTAPFFGALFAVAIWRERLSPAQAGAGGLFILALFLLTREKHLHSHRHEAMDHEHLHVHDEGHHRHSHPGGKVNNEHSHRHRHDEHEHAHPHWPDLHHRHSHAD